MGAASEGGVRRRSRGRRGSTWTRWSALLTGGEGLTRQEGDMMVVKLQGRLPMIH